MIVFVRNFAKLFEYYGKCRHGLGGDDFALGPCTSEKNQEGAHIRVLEHSFSSLALTGILAFIKIYNENFG